MEEGSIHRFTHFLTAVGLAMHLLVPLRAQQAPPGRVYILLWLALKEATVLAYFIIPPSEEFHKGAPLSSKVNRTRPEPTFFNTRVRIFVDDGLCPPLLLWLIHSFN